MSECVWMDMREVMLFAEFTQPVGNAVRVHPASVILCKDVAAINPAVSLRQPYAELFRFPLAKQL